MTRDKIRNDAEKAVSDSLVEESPDAWDQLSPQYFGAFTSNDIAEMFDIDPLDIYKDWKNVRAAIAEKCDDAVDVWELDTRSPQKLYEMMILVPDDENIVEYLRNNLYNIYKGIQKYNWDITAHHWKNERWK